MKYRFNETGYLQKRILSSDNEQSRASVKKVPFRCFEVQSSKGGISNVQGSENKTISLSIQTDNKEIGMIIENGDNIEFRKYNYAVHSVDKIRSLKSRNAYEFIINLR